MIINTTFGILTANTSTHIKRNTILNHTFGISMQDTSNIAEDNYIYTPQTQWTPDPPKNTWGIEDKIHHYPSCVSISNNNTVINHLVGIACKNSNNHIITENNIIDNYIGIHIANATHCEIQKNHIENTYWYGVYLDASSNNNILRNTIINNSFYGIYLQYSDNNIIERNKVANTNEYGMNLEDSSYNNIKENNFMENDYNAYFKSSLFNRWTRNYWDRARLLPYPIIGKMILWKITIPWINIDWSPAKKLYDI
jgi:parallel beta-helix repeat protein